VEPKEGKRKWKAMASLDKELLALGEAGIEVILVVRSTPPWAQQTPGSYCGPVKSEKLGAFGAFMYDLVRRYSAPPYNIKYWEIGNEPDVDPSLVPSESPFGCWGDEDDEFYGGEYYAEMLKVVYPAIKTADPEAKVLIGGLLLDCDPTNPPGGKTCNSSRYFEGILHNEGANYFDIVSFHGYPYYDGTQIMDEGFPGWDSRGGVVAGKVDFLREVMRRYDIVKPIFHTEGALICPEWNQQSCSPPRVEFFEAQADYMVILNVRNWVNGLAGTIWYQFDYPGWRFTSMLGENSVPKPVYEAFKFMNEELAIARYTRTISDFRYLRGYEFITPDKYICVLWSPDNRTYGISLPVGVIRVLDKYGNVVTPQHNILAVRSPVYMELYR
jgi:hypothetical protein